jgi:hypothetical protein
MRGRTNDPDQMMNGFDAYETAWDMVSKRLWSVLGFNAMWFGCFVLATLSLFMLCVHILDSWTGFVTCYALFLLMVLPLWEGANILRYGADEGFPQRVHELPVVRIIVARFLFILLLAPAYLMLVLPGIYLHSRLSLYLPVLLRSPTVSPMQSLSRSWLLSRSRFVRLYTLWIAVVVSHPVSLLPFGLGLILRQPLNGLAKDLMFWSCSNRTRDGPA